MCSQPAYKSLSFRGDFSPLLKLAFPLILTGALQSSLGFFENAFLAQLGQQVLAASALVSWLFFTMIAIIFGIFSSVNVLVSRRHGANDQVGIVRVLRDALILAIVLTPLTFLLFWNASDIFLLFGQKPELAALAKLYLHGLAWGLFPKFILIIAFELLIGLGHSRVIMIVSMISIPLYILFSYVLIFGKFGFPMLAIAGAGWGMTAADWIITTILCVTLWFSKNYRQYVRSVFAWVKPTYFWEILHIGVPMGAMFCVETGYFFMMTIVMGWIGVETLAANQITMQYAGALTSVIFSTTQAISVRMGHLLGANEIHGAEKAAYAGVIFSVIYMVIIAQLYWFAPRMLISVDFTLNNPHNDEVVRLATAFLFICAFFQILEAIRLSLFGALRGLKDTHFTLLTSIICFWCIALPVGYLFSIPLNFGGEAFWWAMVAGAFCSVILLVRRFHTIMLRQPIIRVMPEKPLFTESVAIFISNLPVNARVKLRAEQRDQDHHPWRASEAIFTTSNDGTLDLKTQAPISGSYSGIDPMGLLLSWTPIDNTEYSNTKKGNELCIFLSVSYKDKIIAEKQIHYFSDRGGREGATNAK